MFGIGRKKHTNWMSLLCNVPAGDYVYQSEAYELQLQKAVQLLQDAEAVLIGAGAGASAAAGITYGGKRFTDHFSEFIEHYGPSYPRDMYGAGFYPYPSQEAKWGYWSKHALMNRFEVPALPLYQQLLELVKEKDYFVLTTNVDHQFLKAGFDTERIFATQGNYGCIQCERGCHPRVYDAEDLFYQMDQARVNCEIPSNLVPKCPVCGGNMAMHLRCDQYFVEDEAWKDAADRYAAFVKACKTKKTVLLELGVGFNTPVIIRFPFEKMVRESRSCSLIRINKQEAFVPQSFGERAIGMDGDLAKIIKDVKEEMDHDAE